MKKYIVIELIGMILVAGGIVAWYQGFLGGDRALYRTIKHQPAMITLWSKAMEKKTKVEENPEKASAYFDLGLVWKSIAEQMNGEDSDRAPFFQKSLEAYEAGIERFGEQNILFYLNAGKLAARIQDFEKAKRYYEKAIEISPADENGYLYLVDLSSYYLKKGKEDILSIFEKGMKIMLDPTPLFQGRASYLRRIGDIEGALKDYELLAEKFPAMQGFKNIVNELRQERDALNK